MNTGIQMHINDLDTPTLLVDTSVLDANIRRMATYCKRHKIGLRPQVDSHRSPMIAYKQIAAGASGIACQTLRESEVFADAGFNDILIRDDIVGREKLTRLMQLAERISVCVTADSRAVAEGISQAAKRTGHRIPILIEMDVGGKRRGTSTAQDTVEFGKQISELPHVELAGVMSPPVPPTARSDLSETLGRLEQAGIVVPVVSGGDTRHAFQTHKIPEIDELCVGAYVFCDLSHVYGNACEPADCALTVLTTVISTPTADRVILDAGANTLTRNHRKQPGPPYDCVYGGIQGEPDATLSNLSEGHGHLNTAHTNRRFKVGEKVRMVPIDSSAVASMNDTFALVRGVRVLEVLPIY
ncbi:MAG: alanine racemase [Candidatus Poribacteria bacterium]|nr:alanine racemase [Candidatus Poribacteria bacterium]